jgi:TetR/AcrR family transcriptional repressor of lmrAB and yxaGH operons
MIETAERLLRRDGYVATSWRKLIDESGTPWGSVQHHFPGGKEQLAVAAVELGGEHTGAALRDCLSRADSVVDGIRLWFEMAGDVLRESGFRDGCPVATVALETVPASVALTGVCGSSMQRWRETLADALSAEGTDVQRANQLATVILANFEGSLLLSRVERSTEPLRLAVSALAGLLSAEHTDRDADA